MEEALLVLPKVLVVISTTYGPNVGKWNLVTKFKRPTLANLVILSCPTQPSLVYHVIEWYTKNHEKLIRRTIKGVVNMHIYKLSKLHSHLYNTIKILFYEVAINAKTRTRAEQSKYK